MLDDLTVGQPYGRVLVEDKKISIMRKIAAGLVCSFTLGSS